MLKGVVMIAVGVGAKTAIYGKFAYNLALSIKYHSPNVKIQLIYNDEALSHLQDHHKTYFDIMTPIDRADMIEDGVFTPSKAKMNMYKYLAFNENLYLDVDSVVIKDIEPLFDEFSDDYHCTVVGVADDNTVNFREMQWCEIGKLRKHYSLNGHKIPATNSSFQFIRKGEKTEALFNQILDNFDNKIPDKELGLLWGAGKQPDELYLNVALAQLDMMPQMKREPVCYRIEQGLNIKEDYAKHYILSLFGGIGFTNTSIVKQCSREIQNISVKMLKRNIEFKYEPLMRLKYVDIK